MREHPVLQGLGVTSQFHGQDVNLQTCKGGPLGAHIKFLQEVGGAGYCAQWSDADLVGQTLRKE